MPKERLLSFTRPTQMQHNEVKTKSCATKHLKSHPISLFSSLYLDNVADPSSKNHAMDNPAPSNIIHTLSAHTRLAVALSAVTVHLLTLTILIGVSTAHPTTHLPQHVLAWSGLALGWIGAVAIMDWGAH